MCDSYMGELGELSIYKVFQKNPKSRKRFEDFLCRGPGIRSECTDDTIEKRKPPRKWNYHFEFSGQSIRQGKCVSSACEQDLWSISDSDSNAVRGTFS